MNDIGGEIRRWPSPIKRLPPKTRRFVPMNVADPTPTTSLSPLPDSQDFPPTGYGQTTIGNQPQLSAGELEHEAYLLKWGGMTLSGPMRPPAVDPQTKSLTADASAARPPGRPRHYKKPMWDLDPKSDQTGHEGTVYTRCYGSTGVPQCGSTTNCARCSSMIIKCGKSWSHDAFNQTQIIGTQSRK
jgi:hypothetical protein